MSSLDPTKSDLTSAMKAHAKMLIERAENFATYAEGLAEMDEGQFMAHLGNEYSGPGFVRQMEEEVHKASEVRPSDLFSFRLAMTNLFAKAQREAALAPAAQS